MKKTLALALVAAMTISMASMTAFAKVSYNDDPVEVTSEDLVATCEFTADEMAAMLGGDFTAKDGELFKDAEATLAAADADVKDKLTFSQLGVRTPKDTALYTFNGWTADGTNICGDDDVLEFTKTAKSGSTAEKWTLAKVAGNATATTGKLTTDVTKAGTDKEIQDNIDKLDKQKKEEDKKKENEDKLQKLDEKYGANIKDDNTNGKDANNGKAIKITTNPVRKTKGQTGEAGTVSDFFSHAVNVAGVSDDDGKKTWVFDVTKTDGVFGDGNTAQIEFDLGFGDDADLSQFDWKVYHIKGWCKAEQVKNVEIVGNKLYAWTNDFSPFVVTRGDVKSASAGTTDASNPSTGDFSAVPVALLAAAALGATGFVAYKKRKAE